MPVPFRIEDGFMVFEKSLTGRWLRKPVKVSLELVQSLGEKGLLAYVLESLVPTRPTLIPFVLNNQSLIRMARHFLRHCSASRMSVYAYANDVAIYSRFLENSPDMIINDVKSGGNIPDAIKVQNHIGFLEEYLAKLQDDGLSPGRVHGAVKHIRTFYRTNGVVVNLQEKLSRRVVNKDRSPQPEELVRVLEVADLRGKVVVSLLALGGFRENVLAHLQYRHVRDDLEKGIVPIHVHVDIELVKAKIADHDTFLGGEGAEFLKLYMIDRQKGSADGRHPPEMLNDNSPLIRDVTSHEPRGVGPKQIRTIVRGLYRKAGLLKTRNGRLYDLRTHSLRKYFKTQHVALGVPEPIVDYWMGHVTDVYNDTQSLGIEKLRQIYANAKLSIRPRTRVSKIEALKEMVRAMGLQPEQVLNSEALTNPAATYVGQEPLLDHQAQVLSKKLRELIEATASGSNALRGD